MVRAVYAYYANGCPGSFTYYTEEECKENVEIDSIKLESQGIYTYSFVLQCVFVLFRL